MNFPDVDAYCGVDFPGKWHQRRAHTMRQHNVPSPFHALFNVFNDQKKFIYHFHLAGIVQLLHIFSLLLLHHRCK